MRPSDVVCPHCGKVGYGRRCEVPGPWQGVVLAFGCCEALEREFRERRDAEIALQVQKAKEDGSFQELWEKTRREIRELVGEEP